MKYIYEIFVTIKDKNDQVISEFAYYSKSQTISANQLAYQSWMELIELEGFDPEAMCLSAYCVDKEDGTCPDSIDVYGNFTEEKFIIDSVL